MSFGTGHFLPLKVGLTFMPHGSGLPLSQATAFGSEAM